MDVRRSRIKQRIQSSDLSEIKKESRKSLSADVRMSLIAGPNTANYQRGSHPVTSQVLEYC